MVMKVAKNRSNIVEILNELRPCYVSPNTVIGMQDCIPLFPSDYNAVPDEPDEADLARRKKRRKKKKKRRVSEVDVADEVSLDSEDTLDDISGDEDEPETKEERHEIIDLHRNSIRIPEPPAPTPDVH